MSEGLDKLLQEMKEQEAKRSDFEQFRHTLKSVSKAVMRTAEKHKVSNRVIINDILSYEDYIAFLIEEEVIPNVDSFSFIDKAFSSEFLDAIGEDY